MFGTAIKLQQFTTGAVRTMYKPCTNHDWINNPIKLIKVDNEDFEANVIEITAFYYVGKKALLNNENKEALLKTILEKVKELFGPKEPTIKH